MFTEFLLVSTTCSLFFFVESFSLALGMEKAKLSFVRLEKCLPVSSCHLRLFPDVGFQIFPFPYSVLTSSWN